MPRWLLLLVGLALGYGAWKSWAAWPRGGVTVAPLTLGDEPVQEALDPPVPHTVKRDGHTFFLLQTHRYHLVGEVLSASTYDLAWTSDFYDVDLGLAWGAQVDRLKRDYQFYQDARWLFWRSATQPSPEEQRYVTTHVGNVHSIPAEGNDKVARALRSAEVGDLVALDGALVVVQDAGTNVLARSSTSREDTGNGACEIMWVDRIQIGTKLYE